MKDDGVLMPHKTHTEPYAFLKQIPLTNCIYWVNPDSNVSWGQHGAHKGPIGPMGAPYSPRTLLSGLFSSLYFAGFAAKFSFIAGLLEKRDPISGHPCACRCASSSWCWANSRQNATNTDIFSLKSAWLYMIWNVFESGDVIQSGLPNLTTPRAKSSINTAKIRRI